MGAQMALEALGLKTEVRQDERFAGDFVIIKSRIPRYGDMASFGVCVYPIGERSFYDADREQRERLKATQGQEAWSPPA